MGSSVFMLSTTVLGLKVFLIGVSFSFRTWVFVGFFGLIALVEEFSVFQIEVVDLEALLAHQGSPDGKIYRCAASKRVVVQIGERGVHPVDPSVRLLPDLVRIWKREECSG